MGWYLILLRIEATLVAGSGLGTDLCYGASVFGVHTLRRPPSSVDALVALVLAR